MANQVALAREAVARESWAEAYRILSDVDAAELGPSDLEGLAEAAWWLTRPEEAFDARQRAYAGYAARGEDLEAGGAAARIAIDRFQRGEGAVGAGWLMRAQRHLRDLPEARQHGLLACVESTVARFSGETDGAETLARRAV